MNHLMPSVNESRENKIESLFPSMFLSLPFLITLAYLDTLISTTHAIKVMAFSCFGFLIATAAILYHIVVVEADYRHVGVCYGRFSNGMDAATAVNLFPKYNIPRMRLIRYDKEVVEAVRGVGVEVTLGVKNEDLPGLSTGLEAVNSWFDINVAPYLCTFLVNYIVVGDKAIPGVNQGYVLAVMTSFRQVLAERDLSYIKLTTTVSKDVLQNVLPPSNANLTKESLPPVIGLTDVLKEWKYPLMVSVYPYDYYAAGIIPEGFATFTENNFTVQDGQLVYRNMLDVLVDAFSTALEKGGVGGVEIVVGETGWPTAGNGMFTTPVLAGKYNQNFLNHISSKEGTPKRPNTTMEGYIYALFDDNQAEPGPQQHFGIFDSKWQPAYNLIFP